MRYPNNFATTALIVMLSACGDKGVIGASAPGTTTTTDGGMVTNRDAAPLGVDGVAPPSPGDCSLPNPAFCETFETASPGGRSGPLDERRWSFSRYSHLLGSFMVRPSAGTTGVDPFDLMPLTISFPASFCGASFSGILPGADIAECPGLDGAAQSSNQLNEVYNDAGDFAVNDMRIRQPIDFAGRTATVVVDVDAKFNTLNIGHGWWVEFWISEDPSPFPYHGAPTVHSFPRAAVGFTFQGTNCDKVSGQNSLTDVFVTKDYKILHDYSGADFTSGNCFQTADGKLNRFKLLISQSQAQVFVSDSNTPGNQRLIGVIDHLDLPFTRGYVHLEHSQYNAHKDGNATPSQTYRWDNVGFDGPMLSTPRGYDVQEPRTSFDFPAGGMYIGWYIKDATNLTVTNVDLTGAKSASLNFNIMSAVNLPLNYRFNGGPWHAFTLPSMGDDSDSAQVVRTYSVDAPISELVSGTNTIDFDEPAADPAATSFVNVDLTVEVN